MSSSDKITLFDIPCKKPEYGCWSPNVWKTRLILNYKKLPYTTTWVTHPKIEPTLSSLGLSPNAPKPPGAPGPPVSAYTVPAVKFQDDTCVMDSSAIAAKLEELHPEPSLRLESGLHEKVGPVLGRLAGPLMPVFFPLIQRNILMPETVEAWTAPKERGWGMSIEEFEKARGGEQAWEAAGPGFEAMRKFLRENKKDEGPFLLGSQVCYGDFVLASMMESFRRIDQGLYDRACENAPDLKVLHEACGEWLKEDR